MKILLPLLLIQLIFIPVVSIAQTSASGEASAPVKTSTSKSTEQKLKDLERRMRDFEEWYSEYYVQSKNRVSPFLGEKITIGGFFETALTHLGGPDTQSQNSANSFLLGINLTAEFDENTRFVTQI